MRRAACRVGDPKRPYCNAEQMLYAQDAHGVHCMTYGVIISSKFVIRTFVVRSEYKFLCAFAILAFLNITVRKLSYHP